MRSGMTPVAPAVFLFLLGWLASAAAAQAQYPNRMVRAIVPYTPGSSADLIARNLGPRLAESWKVPFVVDNRAGASGIIGVQAVVAAPGDGYTVLVMADNFASAASVRRNSYDPVNDLDPVILLARGDYALMASASFPAKSVAELHADVATLLKEPAVAELMQKQGMTPAGGTPEELHELIRSDFERWNKIVREANIKAD